MKDNVLKKFMNTRAFKRLTPRERMVELQDYDYQKRNFNQRKEGEHVT